VIRQALLLSDPESFFRKPVEEAATTPAAIPAPGNAPHSAA